MRQLLRLVVVVAVIVLGGLIGTLLVRDPGYVLIAYDSLVMETSVWVALVLLSALLFTLWAVGWSIRRAIAGQIRVLDWASTRKRSRAREQTVRGLLVLAEGRWADAKKLLLGAADGVETPLINYVNAARAAHEQGHREERDALLARAQDSTPGARFAVTLNQAEFHIEDGQFEQALAGLLGLRKRAPKQTAVLAMLAQCYEGLADWPALRELLGDLAKYNAVPTQEQSRLQRLVWSAHLLAADDPQAALKKLPKALRRDAELLKSWIDAMGEDTDPTAAEFVMRTLLDEAWDSSVAARYGLIQTESPGQQLGHARRWAKAHATDANLLLTLGRLCLATEAFDQAREHLEASLRIAPSGAAYGELGRLCIAQGDERRGTEFLLKSVEDLPDLPLPAAPTVRPTGVAS